MKYLLAPLLLVFCFSPAYAYDVTANDLANPADLGSRMGAASAAGHRKDITNNPVARQMTGGAAAVTITGRNPARGATGVASVNTVTTAVRCGGIAYAAGLSLKGTCVLNPANAVVGAVLSGCTASEAGGACKDTDYLAPQQTLIGQTATFGKFTAVVNSCNDTNCSVTITNSDSFSRTGSTLNADAGNLAATASQNSAIGNVKTAHSSQAYQTQMNNTAGQMRNCVNAVNAGLSNSGTVQSCDGSAAATVNSSGIGGSCDPVSQCVNTVSTTDSWTEVCDRNVTTVQVQCSTGQACSTNALIPLQCTETNTPSVTATFPCAEGTYLPLGSVTIAGVYRVHPGTPPPPPDYGGTSTASMEMRCDPLNTSTVAVRFTPAQSIAGQPLPAGDVDLNTAGSVDVLLWSVTAAGQIIQNAVISGGCDTGTCSFTVKSDATGALGGTLASSTISLPQPGITYNSTVTSDNGCSPSPKPASFFPSIPAPPNSEDEPSDPKVATATCAKVSSFCSDSTPVKMVIPSNCQTCPAQPVPAPCWQTVEQHECSTDSALSLCGALNLGGCNMKKEICSWVHNGNCVAWDREYSCGPINPNCTAVTPIPAGWQIDTSTCTAPLWSCLQVNPLDDNQCLVPGHSKSCYASDPNDPNMCTVSPGCQLTATTCLETDPMFGNCTSVSQEFSCSNTHNVCTKYQMVNPCTGSLTKGLDNITDSEPKSFDEAIGAMGLANEISKSMASGAVQVFSGEPGFCTKGVGIAAMLTNDCCKINLTKRGNKPFGQCADAHVELAAARRAARTVYIGQRCSRKKRFIGCVRRTQAYCVFTSLLARIINVQGRSQINALVGSGPSNATTAANTTFSYYSANNNPSWTNIPTSTNVTLLAYQWPQYCKTEETYAQALAAGTAQGDSCPAALKTPMASCDGNACAAMATPPANFMADDKGWNIVDVNVMRNATVPVSPFAMVTGACDPVSEVCTYKPTTWNSPGGQLYVKSQIDFPVYTGVPAGQYAYDDFQVGAWTITPRPVHGAAGVTLPATVAISYADPALGISGTANVPSSIPVDAPVALAGTGLSLFGECSQDIKYCDYTITRLATASPISWGSARHPNCRGFTVDELSLLNFNKMDFSEWINSIKPDIETSGASAAALSASAAADQQQFFNAYSGNATKQTSITSAVPPVRIRPHELKQTSNRVATLEVTSNWPQLYDTPAQNNNPVTAVLVDWGHGGPQEALVKVGNLWQASHQFPDAVNGNRKFTITANLHTANSGVQTVTTSVTVVYVTGKDTTTMGTAATGGSSGYQLGVDPVTGTNLNTVPGTGY